VVAEPPHSFLGLGDTTVQLRLKGFGQRGFYKDVFGFTVCESDSEVEGSPSESVYGVLVSYLAVGFVLVCCGYQEVVYICEDARSVAIVRSW